MLVDSSSVAEMLAATLTHLCCWGLHLFVAPGDPAHAGLIKDKKLMLYSKAKFIMSSWDKKLNSEQEDEGIR